MLQHLITNWAQREFGPLTPARVMARLLEEATELNAAVAYDMEREKIEDEIADVGILLSQMAELHGVNLELAMRKKMVINEQRVWRKDNSGYGTRDREA